MSYREKRQGAGDREEGGYGLTCSECRAPTPWGVLSMYGARCTKCFEAYARNGRPKLTGNEPPLTLAEKREFLQHLRTMLSEVKADKEWAYRLRDREARYEQLSPAQRSAWRQALRVHIGGSA